MHHKRGRAKAQRAGCLCRNKEPTRYVPVPYYPYWPWYPQPSAPIWSEPLITWTTPNTTGTITVATTPYEPTSRVDFNNDGTVFVPQLSIVQ